MTGAPDPICPCCGNRRGCDCYSVQSPQFRKLALAESVCVEAERQLAVWDALYPDRRGDSADNRKIRELVAAWRAGR